jgi:hypothetical protein
MTTTGGVDIERGEHPVVDRSLHVGGSLADFVLYLRDVGPVHHIKVAVR